MAQITGQAGINLTSELAAYLQASNGNLTTEQLSTLINGYLTGGDKLAAQGGSIISGIYKRFGEFDQISGKIEIVTTGLWSGDNGQLSTFFTSSVQAVASSSNYYLNVYDGLPGNVDSTIQFAVAYGHKTGGGSADLDANPDSTRATKATYAQYRSLLLEQDDDYFTFDSASGENLLDSDDIYIINISRARYKETMDAQNWELSLSGSLGTFTFIDDSGKKFSDADGKSGRVFYVVSGSLNLGEDVVASVEEPYAANGQGYGLFYQD